MILLHPPRTTAGLWGELPEALRSHGLDVIAPDIREEEGMRYVARASLVISAAAPNPPLVLVGGGDAGPLLPAVAAAQRAAHRTVGGYVFLDAELPVPRRFTDHDHHGHGALPVPADWPDAPCGYLSTRGERTPPVRLARLRGWQVAALPAGGDLARALSDLVRAL